MQEIVVINDDSHQSVHTAEYALHLAKVYQKNIVLVNLAGAGEPQNHFALVQAQDLLYNAITSEPQEQEDLAAHLRSLCTDDDFTPRITNLEVQKNDEVKLINYLNTHPVWMTIMPAAIEDSRAFRRETLNMQSVIYRIQCPLLIVPPDSVPKNIERIVYVADLRYAQIPVLQYLTKFFQRENIILTHRCAPGLPEIDRSYANDLFINCICPNLKSDQIFFSQMSERKIDVLVDAVINGMQADWLVCVNRHFHFDELVGKNIMSKLPHYVNIPMLVFPN